MKYDDLLDYEYKGVRRHPQMSPGVRAAQFAPFSALNGYDEQIAETARRTVRQQDMSDYQLQELSRKLTEILALDPPREVEITYFRPDSRKPGGAYFTARGVIRKVEKAYDQLLLTDGRVIPLSALSDIRICK